MKRFTNLLVFYGLITLFAGLVYVTVQQNFRQGANDPQIQMAEDAASMISAGTQPLAAVPAARVDIAKSLAPFMVVYDNSGKVLAASGILDSQVPQIPAGVLAYTNVHGEDRLTWQPKNGVRIATVVAKLTGSQPGFVLAGRNMREVERRESELAEQVLIVWALSMLLVTAQELIKGKKF
jgi:hypothetical protein